jgi:aminoglycoside 3-N-acetyltransferase I
MQDQAVIKKLSVSDLDHFNALVTLFHEIFESDTDAIPCDDYLNQLLSNPDFVVFVLIVDDLVMGGLTAYVLPKYYSEEAELFLYDVAIHPDIQRQGHGKELIHAVKQYCLDHNIADMFVDAHDDDIHALEFYHNTGGKGEKVWQFSYQITHNLNS